jgi:photosystem II stability/assembly factor-like uncharacterized protein
MKMLAALLLALAGTATAQFDILDAKTTASLRGIDAVTPRIAWASGSRGTVLLTTDGGATWKHCAVPDGGDKLDFRGVQGFDASTALIMASGAGDLSRVYKTTDGCDTWKLVLQNPDGPKEGFFDEILFLDSMHGFVFGDPAHGGTGGDFTFRFRITGDGGKTWGPVTDPEMNHPGQNLMPLPNEGGFAASNTAVAVKDGWLWFGTSAARIAKRRLYEGETLPALLFGFPSCHGALDPISGRCGTPWADFTSVIAPMAAGTGAGVFSLQFRSATVGIAVGGDYTKPAESLGSAAYTTNGGFSWTKPETLPSGYRSAVAYDAASKAWLAVGTNGADVSKDDGRNWTSVTGDASSGWNAISLPFVVGGKGKIGKLKPGVLSK